jgi:hypothetical protein
MTTYRTEREIQFDNQGIRRFLDIYRDPQAWLNLAFLFVAFPLGIVYFVALVTGISLGAGLAITLIGIPLLFAVFYASGWVAQFEAWLSNRLLGADVRPVLYAEDVDGGMMERVGATLKNPDRWKALAYLFLRFPMGIVGFVAGTILFSIPAALITAPFTYRAGDLDVAFWTINTFPEALVASVLGVFVGAAALHGAGFVTAIWRKAAEVMLSPVEKSKRKNDFA